jgi:AcrR family transcriptional regulator
MGRPAQTPAIRWIDEGLRALARGGPGAVRVEALARALGVTKGGFYNHFDDRPALLKEMLDTWEAVGVDEPIKQVESGGGDARAKVQRLFEIAHSSDHLIEIELSIREWAKRDAAVAQRLKRVDNRRMDYMRSLFGAFCADENEVEVRCLIAFALFIGPPHIAADDGPLHHTDVLKLALSRLLE